MLPRPHGDTPNRRVWLDKKQAKWFHWLFNSTGGGKGWGGGGRVGAYHTGVKCDDNLDPEPRQGCRQHPYKVGQLACCRKQEEQERDEGMGVIHIRHSGGCRCGCVGGRVGTPNNDHHADTYLSAADAAVGTQGNQVRQHMVRHNNSVLGLVRVGRDTGSAHHLRSALGSMIHNSHEDN